MPTSRVPNPPLEPSGLVALSIELVPESSWFANVRTVATDAEWDKCKAFVRARSGDRCEVCYGVGPKWPVECHEIWRYDLETLTQVLDGLIALCPDCHKVKHIGFAASQGEHVLARSIQHLANVNQWDEQRTEDYIAASFSLWRQRSQMQWELDLTWLERELGITLDTRRRPRRSHNP